jgi:hypothetical protein
LSIQALFGFKTLLGMDPNKAIKNLAVIALLILALLMEYNNFTIHRHKLMPWNYFLLTGTAAILAPLAYVVLKQKNALSLVGYIVILLAAIVPSYRSGLYTIGEDSDLMKPGPRNCLNPPSPGIEQLKAENQEPFRVVGLGTMLSGDYAAAWKIEDIRSCSPLTDKDYVDLIRGFPGIDYPDDNWVFEIKNLTAAEPLLDFLNVKYRTMADVEFPEKTIGQLTYRNLKDFSVIESHNVWPRAFFANKINVNTGVKSFTQQLEQNQTPFISINTNQLNDQLIALENQTNPVIQRATHYKLLANSTEFDIDAPSAGVVCLTETKDPGFTATANNQKATVLTVNHAFKGICLTQPGHYHIQFTYRPQYWAVSCTLFCASTAAMIGLAGFLLLMRPAQNPPTGGKQNQI